MRTVNRPNEIDDIANLNQSLAVGNTADLIGPYTEAIIHSYDRYTMAAPELAQYEGVPMHERPKQRMLQIFKRTNKGNLQHLRERCVNPVPTRAEGWDSADLPGMCCGGSSTDRAATLRAG